MELFYLIWLQNYILLAEARKRSGLIYVADQKTVQRACVDIPNKSLSE
jgi:hypothetical protein